MSEVLEIAKRARAASLKLASYSSEAKNAAIEKIADAVLARADEIKAANALDAEAARGKISAPMLERLSLNDKKIAAMAEAQGRSPSFPTPSAK